MGKGQFLPSLNEKRDRMTRTHEASYKTSLVRLLFLLGLTPVGACLRAVLAEACAQHASLWRWPISASVAALYHHCTGIYNFALWVWLPPERRDWCRSSCNSMLPPAEKLGNFNGEKKLSRNYVYDG